MKMLCDDEEIQKMGREITAAGTKLALGQLRVVDGKTIGV